MDGFTEMFTELFKKTFQDASLIWKSLTIEQ